MLVNYSAPSFHDESDEGGGSSGGVGAAINSDGSGIGEGRSSVELNNTEDLYGDDEDRADDSEEMAAEEDRKQRLVVAEQLLADAQDRVARNKSPGYRLVT
jgi:hypothetical protein